MTSELPIWNWKEASKIVLEIRFSFLVNQWTIKNEVFTFGKSRNTCLEVFNSGVAPHCLQRGFWNNKILCILYALINTNQVQGKLLIFIQELRRAWWVYNLVVPLAEFLFPHKQKSKLYKSSLTILTKEKLCIGMLSYKNYQKNFTWSKDTHIQFKMSF